MKKEVSVSELRVGDCIENDIKSRSGQVLVAKGTPLTEKHLERLRLWFSDSTFIIDDSKAQTTKDYSSKKESMEKLQSNTIECMNRVLYASGEDLDKALQLMNYNVFNICEDLKSVSDLPDDVIKIMYHNQAGSHYFRVTRMAVALASIYNRGMSENMQISLSSICLASLLHDYGRRYKNDLQGLTDLTFNSTTLKGTTIHPISIGSTYDDHLHSVYSYVALKGRVPEDVRKTILYCNYQDFNSFGSASPEVKAASIISLCTLYDQLLEQAMSQDLSSPFENVLSYMGQLAHNDELDQEIYKLFLDHIPIYPNGVKVLLSNGQQAFVVGASKGFPTKPSVQVSNNGETEIINLSEITNITIRKVLQDEEEQTSNIVSDIQSKQLQNSSVPMDRSVLIPEGDSPSTLELPKEEFDQPKTLHKKLKNFFRK